MPYARIVEGVVKKVTISQPNLGRSECALVVECDETVQEGWLFEGGVLAAPPEPNPDAALLAQIAMLEALQTPRLLREAMKKKGCIVNKPGTLIHGLSPEDALDVIDTELESLRAQLALPVYYQG